MMRAFAAAVVLLAAPFAMAAGMRAPAAFEPPVMTKAGLESILHALPPQVTAHCLDAVAIVHEFNDFAGQNKALEAASRAGFEKVLEIGRVLPVALDTATLFDAPPLRIDGYFHYIAAVASRDAFQIALEADLSELRPGDEVFVLDPEAVRAFGPIDAPRTEDGLAWLPMAGGDTAVLVVRSVHDTAPPIVVTALSHGYIDLAAELAKEAGSKVAPCNNHIACETDPDLQFLSSGIGRYTYTRGGGTSLCSGALLNVPGTAALEPYFLTANHCVSTQSQVASMQIWWDYRAANCAGGGVPSLGSLPTSLGVNLLRASAPYDHTLVELNSVPTGLFGRAYLGWDAAAPALGDDLIGIHHPVGAAMRISYGNVTVVSMTSSTYPSHIRVEWYDGVTEGGSSGSPLLLPNRDNALIGLLHGGSVHVCPEDPARNWDVYGPFRLFFPVVEDILTAQDGNGPPPPSLRLAGTAQWSVSGSSLTMQAQRIENTGGASGTLRLRLLATASPYTGSSSGGYFLGSASLGGLSANSEFVNVSRTVPYTAPPYGTYYTALLLEEFQGIGTGFVVVDHLTFPNAQVLGNPPGNMHGAGFKLIETDFREGVFPVPETRGELAITAADGEVALRLTARDALAPESLWATVEWMGRVEPAAVRWRPTDPRDGSDGWAIVRVPDAVPPGAVITAMAGAATGEGVEVEALAPFEIALEAAAVNGVPSVAAGYRGESIPAILATPVSPIYRIEPVGVYDEAATVRIPMPDGTHRPGLVLHYHSENPAAAGWRRAERVDGWLASDVRMVEVGGVDYLEFAVNHSGIVQLGRVSDQRYGALGPWDLRVTGGAHAWALLVLVVAIALAFALWPMRGDHAAPRMPRQ